MKSGFVASVERGGLLDISRIPHPLHPGYWLDRPTRDGIIGHAAVPKSVISRPSSRAYQCSNGDGYQSDRNKQFFLWSDILKLGST
jgi:hypothetical protein